MLCVLVLRHQRPGILEFTIESEQRLEDGPSSPDSPSKLGSLVQPDGLFMFWAPLVEEARVPVVAALSDSPTIPDAPSGFSC